MKRLIQLIFKPLRKSEQLYFLNDFFPVKNVMQIAAFLLL